MGEDLLVSVGCSLSASWVLCLPCALAFNIVLARRMEESSRTVCSEQSESRLVQFIRGAFSEDEERLFIMHDHHPCKPVQNTIPLMPTTGTEITLKWCLGLGLTFGLSEFRAV